MMKSLICAASVIALGAWTLSFAAHDTDTSREPRTRIETQAPVVATAPVNAFGTVEEARAKLLEARRTGTGMDGVTSRRLDMAAVAMLRTSEAELDKVDCGSASMQTTTGASFTGSGATVEAAINDAKDWVELMLAAAANADCQEEQCPNPDNCTAWVSTLDWQWSFGLPFKCGNCWCVRGTYTGTYLYACRDCNGDDGTGDR